MGWRGVLGAPPSHHRGLSSKAFFDCEFHLSVETTGPVTHPADTPGLTYSPRKYLRLSPTGIFCEWFYLGATKFPPPSFHPLL